MCSLLDDIVDPQPGWHVLWIKSNFEQRVFEQLVEANYEVFLPMISRWSPSEKSRLMRMEPMFKGYMFVRHAIDKASFLNISNTKGVVSILGKSWNNLAQVPEEEISSIRQLVESRMPVTPYPYLKAGTEVRITQGPMANLRGILVKTDQKKGYFVVSVQLLQRSVAVSVDCCDVAPV
jgi:transcription antitermination factor NusG